MHWCYLLHCGMWYCTLQQSIFVYWYFWWGPPCMPTWYDAELPKFCSDQIGEGKSITTQTQCFQMFCDPQHMLIPLTKFGMVTNLRQSSFQEATAMPALEAKKGQLGCCRRYTLSQVSWTAFVLAKTLETLKYVFQLGKSFKLARICILNVKTCG